MTCKQSNGSKDYDFEIWRAKGRFSNLSQELSRQRFELDARNISRKWEIQKYLLANLYIVLSENDAFQSNKEESQTIIHV